MKRPCECGCRFKDHIALPMYDASKTLYCKNCDKHDTWCYNYRPIKNLPWLEWLVR